MMLLIFILISHVCHDRKMMSSIKIILWMWLLYRIPENITSSHGLEFMFLAPVMESIMEQAIGTLVQCSSFKEPITWIQGPCSASGVLRHILESLAVCNDDLGSMRSKRKHTSTLCSNLNKIASPLLCKRNVGYLAALVGHRGIYWHRAENQYTHIWEGEGGWWGDYQGLMATTDQSLWHRALSDLFVLTQGRDAHIDRGGLLNLSTTQDPSGR